VNDLKPSVRWTLWVLFASTFLVPIAANTFQWDFVTVYQDDHRVYLVHKTWWGLKREQEEIRWYTPKGSEYATWCVRQKDGTWDRAFAPYSLFI